MLWIFPEVHNTRFQSLSGFQVRCNAPQKPNLPARPAKFQSLSGFQVRCNVHLIRHNHIQRYSFNPYRVFKFVATQLLNTWLMAYKAVSIPIGFSSSLQRGSRGSGGCNINVSIPIGFSSSLQRNDISIAVSGNKMFQSLSGFQVRCNFQNFRTMSGMKKVSIPIGFSSSLQRN